MFFFHIVERVLISRREDEEEHTRRRVGGGTGITGAGAAQSVERRINISPTYIRAKRSEERPSATPVSNAAEVPAHFKTSHRFVYVVQFFFFF